MAKGDGLAGPDRPYPDVPSGISQGQRLSRVHKAEGQCQPSPCPRWLSAARKSPSCPALSIPSISKGSISLVTCATASTQSRMQVGRRDGFLELRAERYGPQRPWWTNTAKHTEASWTWRPLPQGWPSANCIPNNPEVRITPSRLCTLPGTVESKARTEVTVQSGCCLSGEGPSALSHPIHPPLRRPLVPWARGLALLEVC